MACQPDPPPGSTRRTLMRATMWTAPAVAVATAAPAFATSGTNDIQNVMYRKIVEVPGTENGFYGADNIMVTNDGPKTLAAGTVTLN